MMETVLFALLTLVASSVGTATGFGISTFMVPVLVLFVPLPVTLLFVGIIHLFGDIWKMLLFRKGLEWKLILGFGLPGIVASYIGAGLTFQAEGLPVNKILGLFIMIYVAFLFINRQWSLPRNHGTAVVGGILSGLTAGFFGVGGAVRGAFLTAFNLPRDVYLFTSGIIAFFIDVTRISRYLLGGVELGGYLLTALTVCIPLSFAGAYLAKRSLDKIPQSRFRLFVGVFLFLVGIRLVLS